MKRYLFVIFGENKSNVIKDIKRIYSHFPSKINNITEIVPPPMTATCNFTSIPSSRILLLKDVYIPNGNYTPIYLNSSNYNGKTSESSDSVLDIILKNDEMLKTSEVTSKILFTKNSIFNFF